MDETSVGHFPPPPGLPFEKQELREVLQDFRQESLHWFGAVGLRHFVDENETKKVEHRGTDDQRMVRFFEKQVRWGRVASKRQVQGDDYNAEALFRMRSLER